MFKKILLASEGSENSLRAAEKAIGLAKLIESTEVYVVYVVDGSTSKSDVLRNWDIQGIKEKREEMLRNTAKIAEENSIPYKKVFLRGEPAPMIVKYAESEGIELIVIGSRGLNPLQEMVLGSVSHKVMKRATCPVMVVK